MIFFTSLAILLLGMDFHHINHNRLWLAHSPSLPNYVPHFVGREKEISDLVRLLDPENTDVRTVSIVGPPGFGKSSLAIHVGHEMIDRGVVVNYVNLDEVTIDGLPEKIVSNAGITAKNASVDRLLKWAREVRYPVLLILDNCDVIYHEKPETLQNLLKRVRESASTVMIKFLLTAQYQYKFVEVFKEWSLKEISKETSCKLLHHMTTFEINETTCTKITNLIGNIPLALKVVGAILREHKRYIDQVIKDLKDELLTTLSPSDLDLKVNASLSLSYNYLSARQRKLGRYLALFPGSFSADDACHILADVMKNECSAEIKLLHQRSLLQSLENGRYQFHKIIKEFLAVVKISHDVDTNTTVFMTRFLAYYGEKLYNLSLTFGEDYASALRSVDIEKHNFQYLLERCDDVCSMGLEESLSIFQTVQIALDTRFLTCRFTVIELEKPLADIRSCLEQTIHTIPGVGLGLLRSAIDPEKEDKLVKLMDVLIHIAIILYKFDVTPLVLEEVEVHLDMFEDVIDIPAAGDFYRVLASHYHTLGKLEEMKRCHEKILRRAYAKIVSCQPGTCDYDTISRNYFQLKEYELGAQFFELHLKHNKDKMSLFYYANTLRLLYECQFMIRNHTKAADTLTQLLHLLPSLVNASIPEVYANLKILSRIAYLFRLEMNGMTDEATQLEKKLLMAIKEINATEARHDAAFAMNASILATDLFHAEQYDEVVEVAGCALNLLQKLNLELSIVNLQLILGKAEYHSGKRAESIDHLKKVVKTVYDHPELHEKAQEACHYMIAQFYVDITCVWSDFKTIAHAILVFIVSDTITVDSYTLNQHKAFSTYSASSSALLDILPSELAALVMSNIIDWCIQLIKQGFHMVLNVVTNIFSVTFLLRVVNCVLVAVKFLGLLLCFCCICSSCCICLDVYLCI